MQSCGSAVKKYVSTDEDHWNELVDKFTGGMKNVTCVHAKAVPIVKIWDPELQVACDLNVNNHVALKNTRLVRAYMEIDSRVRPLAMIVKYWTKRRVINEGMSIELFVFYPTD